MTERAWQVSDNPGKFKPEENKKYFSEPRGRLGIFGKRR
jgi:hypothetical protein